MNRCGIIAIAKTTNCVFFPFLQEKNKTKNFILKTLQEIQIRVITVIAYFPLGKMERNCFRTILCFMGVQLQLQQIYNNI